MEREPGEERRKAGRSSLAGQTLESLPCETKGGGGGDANFPVSLVIPIQR